MKAEEAVRLKQFLYKLADDLTIRKGRGYGSDSDTLISFKQAEYIGVLPAELGAWCVLSVKVVRLGNQLKRGEREVGFEGILDTVVDAINYAAYVYLLLIEKDSRYLDHLADKIKEIREREKAK
jgi:hypothetical protein